MPVNTGSGEDKLEYSPKVNWKDIAKGVAKITNTCPKKLIKYIETERDKRKIGT